MDGGPEMNYGELEQVLHDEYLIFAAQFTSPWMPVVSGGMSR